MATFKFRLKNDEKTEELNMETSVQDWKIFRTSMKTFQKNINDYLTTLVNNESSGGDNELVCEDSDSLEEDEKSPKRVLDSSSEPVHKSYKVKKVQH